MLLGLLKRDDGAIRVLGLDPTTEPLELRRRVGYLAEDQTMYGWMRVAEILRFVAPFYPTWDHDLALRYVREFRAAVGDEDQAPVEGAERAAGLGAGARAPAGAGDSRRPSARGSTRSCGNSSIAT